VTPRGPWYISAHAVRQYLRLMRRPVVDDGPEWDRAEDELLAMAGDCAERERNGIRAPKQLRMGADLLEYRGPRPWRLALIVSTAQRAEGTLPQLVDVRAGHAGGSASPNRRRRE
jgi:hypothetical protein